MKELGTDAIKFVSESEIGVRDWGCEHTWVTV